MLWSVRHGNSGLGSMNSGHVKVAIVGEGCCWESWLPKLKWPAHSQKQAACSLCALGFPVHREPTVCGWSQAHRRTPFCHSPGNRLRCIWFLGRKSRVGVVSPEAEELGSHLERQVGGRITHAPPPRTQVGLIMKPSLIFSFNSQEPWNFSMIKILWAFIS